MNFAIVPLKSSKEAVAEPCQELCLFSAPWTVLLLNMYNLRELSTVAPLYERVLSRIVQSLLVAGKIFRGWRLDDFHFILWEP